LITVGAAIIAKPEAVAALAVAGPIATAPEHNASRRLPHRATARGRAHTRRRQAGGQFSKHDDRRAG
jgi:hypothetical protein